MRSCQRRTQILLGTRQIEPQHLLCSILHLPLITRAPTAAKNWSWAPCDKHNEFRNMFVFSIFFPFHPEKYSKMLNNRANNPPKQKHAVEDICNSTTVISGNACYANPAKIFYYHSAFVCRLVPLPLARLWMPVCVCICVCVCVCVCVSVCVCGWAHIIKLAWTECTHATCIVYCVPISLLPPSLTFPSFQHSISAVLSLPSPIFSFSSSLILQPPGGSPTIASFTADLFFTPPSNWIMHSSIKSPTIKGPAMD